MATHRSQVDTPPIAHDPQTGVSIVRNPRACTCGCGAETRVRLHGAPARYGHVAGMRAETPDPHDEAGPEPSTAEASMFELLQDSIRASRKRPVLRIRREARTEPPWSLMTEAMRGEHRWRAADTKTLTGTVKVFDRNGSYPSAMSNVPVAAGELRRTGAIGYNSGHAGIYLVPRFDWLDGPHPLGEIADQPGDAWWVTTPHLRLIIKLVATQRIPGWTILDSWTAPAVTNLFKQFSADVAELRKQTRGTDDYTDIKRKSSIAIRALWPKTARSPFWRPDWSLSVRAEAAVRHWVRADQAVQAGGVLLQLGNVDEVAFLQPKRARQDWCPDPYKLGDGFGYVKAKTTMPATEWNRGVRR